MESTPTERIGKANKQKLRTVWLFYKRTFLFFDVVVSLIIFYIVCQSPTLTLYMVGIALKALTSIPMAWLINDLRANDFHYYAALGVNRRKLLEGSCLIGLAMSAIVSLAAFVLYA